MIKKYLDTSVYEESLKRIEYLFDEFDNVLVSFSGGKDSSVCFHLCYDYAKENRLLDKLAVYHIDSEAQAQMTTDYIENFFQTYDDIKRFWLCLPVGVDCSCRIDGSRWIPWDRDEKDIWTRDIPSYDYVISEDNCPFKMFKGQTIAEVKASFCRYFSSAYGSTAVVIGIRTDESLARYAAITNENTAKYKDVRWINYREGNNLAYPIYDWNKEDVWVYNGKFNKSYNKFYDYLYWLGVKLGKMRVVNPFHSHAEDILRLYQMINYQDWETMLKRVNGVSWMSKYGESEAVGDRGFNKPDHFTWKEYCEFLLMTSPDKVRGTYERKFDSLKTTWCVNGHTITDEAIKYLEDNEIPFVNLGHISRRSKKKSIRFDDLPQESDYKHVRDFPTYKRMCLCILRNDIFLKGLGYKHPKSKDEEHYKKEVLF